ncbi:MAG: hypothetical protein IPJ19_20110 [Planctomycetes bacterium]|nr:hypothetical protein [Planctomycetota bacterium]
MNRRPLLVSLVLAVLIFGGLGAWLLLRHEPARGGEAALAPVMSNTAIGLDPAALEASSGKSALDTTDARTQAIPVGVRLAGPGRLTGRVIERESGLGVPHMRVDLLPMPPAAGEFMGRMLMLSPQTSHMAGRTKPIAVAETDARGAFAFEGVRTGSWFLDTRGPYHVPEMTVRAQVLASGAGGPIDVFVLPGGRVLGTVFEPEARPRRARRSCSCLGRGTS